MGAQKTYWHLGAGRRLPSEYEIVTSKLHYYRSQGFEIKVPLVAWYEQYQDGSPFICSDWDKFSDPRQTTYTKYTSLQADKEIFVEGICQSMKTKGYDRNLSKDWIRILEFVIAPLRFPCHGLQMVAAYVGQMAPASRVTIAAALQAADEMRRIHWLSYRMAQLQTIDPSFGLNSKVIWQEDLQWQPLRKLIEMLLVTYDWGEAFVVLNLLVKPAYDRVFMECFSELARVKGDYLLSEILFSLNEDCEWHREWSQALWQTAVTDSPINQITRASWEEKWQPLIKAAFMPFEQLFKTPLPSGL